jgi:hypothetical protein
MTKPPIPSSLGGRLRAAREYLHLNVDEAATALRIDPDRVRAHENDAYEPEVHELERYAWFYQQTTASLRDDPAPVTPADLSPTMQEQFAALSAHDQAQVLRFAEFLRNAPPRPKK